MKYLLPFILLISIGACAQQLQRYDNFGGTTVSASGIGNITQVIPNATITVFNQPAVGVSCAGGGCVAATTFTSQTGATPCGGGLPLTRPTANVCLATADASGNFGFWAAAGGYQYCIAATNFTTQCFNVILGATLGGNNTFTGQNNINFFKHNAVVWAGPESSKYTTVESALTDTQCATAPSGCELEWSSNFNETNTANVTLGNAAETLYQHIQGWPNARYNCGITTGVGCFTLFSGTGITGSILGETAGTTGGLLFTYPSTANVSCIFCIPGTNGGQGFIKLDSFFVEGNASATVPITLDMASVNNEPVINNLYFLNFPSIGTDIRTVSNAGATAGPMVLVNDWMDGQANTNAQPWVLGANGNTMLGVDIISGVANHPGSGKTMMSINGNRAVAGSSLYATKVMGTYFENLANGSSIAMGLADVESANVDTVPMAIRDTDTAVDISQSAAGRTCNVGVQNLHVISPTNGMTTIKNHISGFTVNGQINVPFYLYGGDGTAGNCGNDMLPFTVDSLEVQFLDRANHLTFDIKPGGQSNPTILSPADALGISGFQCGLTTEQVCFWGLFNQSKTLIWGLGDDGLGNYILSDRTNIKTVWKASPSATGATINLPTACTTTTLQPIGSPMVLCGVTSQKAETGTADANVLTFTPPAAAGTYRSCVSISVASATAGTIAWTLSWTDSNGNAQSNIAQDLFQDGTAAPATTFSTSAAGNYHFCRELDVNNAAASIIVKWAGGGTTAAKMSATIERLI